MRRIRRIALAVAAGALAVAVVVGFAFAGSGDSLAGGVRIDGISVAGLGADEAVRALQGRSRKVVDVPVTFVAGGRRFRFTARQLGVTLDWRAAVDDARREGGGFGPIRGFRRIALKVSGREIVPAVSAYDSVVASALTALAAKVDRPHLPASIELKGLEPSIVRGRPGRVLDQKAAAGAIVQALASLDRPSRAVWLPMRTDPVRVTAASLAPVLARLRTILSAPVRVRAAGALTSVTPQQLASMIEPPDPGSKVLRIGGPAADRVLGRLARLVGSKPVDASFTIDAKGVPQVVPSVAGRKLDQDRTAASILEAASRPTDRIARLVVVSATPKRTTRQAQAMGIKEVVGSYATTYGGIPNRLHNVHLVAKLVDDHLIAPGATFSFNRTTGERSAAKGFLEAPVIINGELQNGLGGGVCQVSTTVFNAAYDAGLPITARTNHALYISHYPLGRDATVDYPGVDLKFRNDTGKWIWLRAFIGDYSLRITLYGTSPHRRVETSTTPLHATGPVPLRKEPDPTLPKGARVVDPTASSTPATAASVHRVVYDAKGKVLYDSVWYSNYVAVPKIVRVGTGPKSLPLPDGVQLVNAKGVPLPGSARAAFDAAAATDTSGATTTSGAAATAGATTTTGAGPAPATTGAATTSGAATAPAAPPAN